MTQRDLLDIAFQAAADRGDMDQMNILELALNTDAVPPRLGIQVGAAAAWYAARGLPVFPLLRNEKRPLPGTHGLKDATTDMRQVVRWEWDHYNIGIATGHLFDVIDVDTTDTDHLRDFVGDGAWLDVRAVVRTPRGWHLWIPADPNAQNLTSEHTHIDYRAKGGYVVVPPSHVGGTVYRWLAPPALEPVAGG